MLPYHEQVFSLSDHIASYRTRINRENGTIGYFVAHLDRIEFTRDVIEAVCADCKVCVVNIDNQEPAPNPNYKECSENCSQCTSIYEDRKWGLDKITLSRGVLMKFTPPSADTMDMIGNTPRFVNAGNQRVHGSDLKLRDWNTINLRNRSNNEHGSSRRLRRLLFRKHVQVTPINRDENRRIDWIPGRYIIYPGR